MSVHVIYYKDGAKMMRPVLTREEYLRLRSTRKQRETVAAVRRGDESRKRKLLEMNYSCLPTPEGRLRGSERPSGSVGMDIDHLPEGQMKMVADCIMAHRQELGLLMLERSARGKGYHLVFRRRPELSQEENLRWASALLGVDYDKGAKDITRVFFATTDSPQDLLFLDDAIFETAQPEPAPSAQPQSEPSQPEPTPEAAPSAAAAEPQATQYNGIPYSEIIAKWWEMYNEGKTPVRSNRDVLTFELAVNLRHICGFDRELMARVIPCYDGFPEAQKMKCIDSALAEKRTQMPKRLRDVLLEVRRDGNPGLDEAVREDDRFYFNRLPHMPQGVADSIEAVGPALAMPALVAICPAIGMLATGVRLDVHGQRKGLNLISYIAGDFASGKGQIDPVIDAWMAETKALDSMYQQREEEWRRRKRAAKNKEEQPEEPKLPVRCLPLNNTVANLAERLANTDGKHAFSFTPEADTVAQKWKSSMSDFSVMLRQSYDGSRYDREARSAEAVNVHIEHLLWNVTMCGTPDALYRVVTNYTDGFQSRIAVARTPDNTYAPLEEKPYVLTPKQAERIRQVAHLLPLMTGTLVLPKLEGQGRQWVEGERLDSMKNDDTVRARQRFRICVTAQRMTCCLMLCRVAEQLISQHGLDGAEKMLRQQPDLWRPMVEEAQTPDMMDTYDLVADYLMETALYFFRERIEAAFSSRNYKASAERQRTGRNDSIFERLDREFGFEGAFQHSVAVKGVAVSNNSVRQMLKNWVRQGLIERTDTGRYRKIAP